MTPDKQAESDELRALAAAVNSEIRSGYANKIIGAAGDTSPRFELYHSAPSLCSHKVRTTMAEKKAVYFSHDMTIMPVGKFVPQNYLPEYVRLRLRGAPGAEFVSGYTGESSVAQQGFDPCVVPTLVDYDDAKVVVDSNAICRHIAESLDTGTDLLPDGLESDVQAQVDVVDRAPHVAALYGAHPDEDRRPAGLRDRIAGVHARKIRVLKTLIEVVGGDEELRAAYQSKIDKEAAAGEFVTTPDEMRNVHQQMAEHVADLEAQLQNSKGPWVLGEAYTLADITWTLSLWRMKWLGMGHLWESSGNFPGVLAYTAQAFQRPSFRDAVVNWPGSHAPSPHVDEHNGPGAAGAFTLHMLRMTRWSKTLFGDPRYKLPPMDDFNNSPTSSVN